MSGRLSRELGVLIGFGAVLLALLASLVSAPAFVAISLACLTAAVLFPFARGMRRGLDAGDALYPFVAYFAVAMGLRGVAVLTYQESPYLADLQDPRSSAFQALMGWVFLASALALAACYLGHASPVAERWGRHWAEALGGARRWPRGRAGGVAALWLLLGLAAAALYARSFGGFSAAARNLVFVATEGSLGQFWKLALMEFAVVGFHVLLLADLSRPRGRVRWHLVLPVAGLLLGLYLFTSSKYLLLRVLVPPLVYYHLLRRPLRLVHLAGFFLLFGGLFPFFYAYREFGFGAWSDIAALLSDAPAGSWLGAAPLLGRAYDADCFAVVLHDTGRTLPFRWGASLLDLFTFFIPRAWWPGKPESYSLEFADQYFGDVALGGMSYVSPSLVGELYLNFHLPGILLGMAFLGALLRAAHVMARGSGAAGALLYGYAFLVAIHLVEGSIAAQLEFLLMSVAPAWLAVRWLQPRLQAAPAPGGARVARGPAAVLPRGAVACAALALAALLAPAAPARAAFRALEEVPVESPLYLALEDLATRYGSPAGFLQTRPWTLAAARGYLEALERSDCACQEDPAFVRVRRMVDEEASGTPPLLRAAAEGATVELSPYGRVGYREDGTARPAVVRDHRLGGSAAAELGERVLVFADYYAATFSPEPHGNPIGGTRYGLIEGVELNAWFDRAFVAAGTPALSARVGHTWLRWGPGRSGTLGLGDAALALDLAEFRWRLLPAVQLAWFVAMLDALEEQYLAGHRLELRAGPGFSLGVSELARFDGHHLAPYYFVPVVGFSLREKQLSRFSAAAADTQERFSKNNVLWTVDASWRVRPGVRLYGELLVDDFSFSSAYRPAEIGYQLGARLSRPLPEGSALGLRLEHTRVTNYTYSTWHQHDFESDGYPLAYPYGPDVEVWWAELDWDRGPNWTVGAAAARVWKGEGALGEPWLPAQGRVASGRLSGVVERGTRASLAAAYSPGRRLSLRLEGGWSGVSDAGHVVGRRLERWFGSSALAVQW